MKFNPLPEIVAGKRLVVVDDSIVRGNTTRQIVQMLRDAGATEVHMRISAPPIRYPCHYGVDMSTREEMIAHDRTDDEIAAELGCDSLALPLARRRLRGDPAPRARPTATPASPASTRCERTDAANGKFALEELAGRKELGTCVTSQLGAGPDRRMRRYCGPS